MFFCRSYRLVALAALVTAVISCGKDKIIPREDLIAIYKEMYVADQWIREATIRNRKADTSYVYRPIIEKHGYTEEDFRRTIYYYTDNPKDFATVFEAVSESLKEDKKRVEILERQEYVRDSTKRAKNALPYRRPDFTKTPDTDYYVTKMYLYMDSTGVFVMEPVDIFRNPDYVRPEDKPFTYMMSGGSIQVKKDAPASIPAIKRDNEYFAREDAVEAMEEAEPMEEFIK